MNKKIFTLASLVVAVAVLAAALAFGYGKGSPAEQTDNNAIGPLRDEGGCLVALGFGWCDIKQKCIKTAEESCSAEEELMNYLRDHISAISPEKEVLGGKFYITELAIKSSSTAEVSYEDGHIALKARLGYNFKDGRLSITDFKILP